MKICILAAIAMLASAPVFGQDQASCKAYFQVLRAEPGMPGLRVGMDSGPKRWWENEGKKQFPGLCLSGSVTSGNKPRYLVIWTKSKTIGQGSLASGEVYGQTATTLRTAAQAERVYQSRWNQAQVTVISVLNDGSLLLPPIHFETGDHVLEVLWPNDTKVLKAAVKYLAQEPAFCPATIMQSRNCR